MKNKLKLLILVGILSFVSACSSDDTTLGEQNRALLEGNWIFYSWTSEFDPGKFYLSTVTYNDVFSVNSITFRKDGTAIYTASTLLDSEEDISVFGYEVVRDIIHYPTRLGSQGSYSPLRAGRYQEIVSVDKNFLVLRMLQFRDETVHLNFYRKM